MSLTSAAEAHIQSYAAVFAKGLSLPISTLSQQMTSFYRYPFISFIHGKSYTVPTHEQMAQQSITYLESWAKHGLMRFKLAKHRVEELSPGCAFCWLTFELDDDDKEGGKKGWTWENVYVYRRGPDGTGGFEATFADNEFLGLAQNAPEILQGLPQM